MRQYKLSLQNIWDIGAYVFEREYARHKKMGSTGGYYEATEQLSKMWSIPRVHVDGYCRRMLDIEAADYTPSQKAALALQATDNAFMFQETQTKSDILREVAQKRGYRFRDIKSKPETMTEDELLAGLQKLFGHDAVFVVGR